MHIKKITVTSGTGLTLDEDGVTIGEGAQVEYAEPKSLRLRCRKTNKVYTMEGDEPCPYCGASIHGLDLSELNVELGKLQQPLPPGRES